MWANIGDEKVWESKTIRLLGKKIDNKLKFDEHMRRAFERFS